MATSRNAKRARPSADAATLLNPSEPPQKQSTSSRSLSDDAKGMIKAWSRGEHERTGRYPTAKETAETFPGYVSPSAASRILHANRTSNRPRGGSQPEIDSLALEHLYRIVCAVPVADNQYYYAAALTARLGFRYAFSAGHIATVIKERLGFTMQARRALANERNSAVSDMYAQQFMMRMLRYGDRIAWFDASGVNNKTGMRTRGWAARGAGGCHAGHAGNRCSAGNSTVIQFMDCDGQCCAPGVSLGGTTIDTITEYFLNNASALFMRDIQCVVLDNALVHARGILSAILGVFGIDIMYLPPYHPNWNPIEELWLDMKRELSENKTSLGSNPKEQIEAALKRIDGLGKAMGYVEYTHAYPFVVSAG